MDELQSGDKIVDLGAMFRSIAIAGGAVASALLLFVAKQSWGICGAGFFFGAVAGLILGLICGRVLYADGQGNVKVVKATPANFPVTLSAAWRAAVLQTVVVLVGIGLTGKISSWPLAIAVAISVNFLIGGVIARLSLS